MPDKAPSPPMPAITITPHHRPGPSLVETRAPDSPHREPSASQPGAEAGESEARSSRSDDQVDPAPPNPEALGTAFYLALGEVDGAPSEDLEKARAHVGDALAALQAHREKQASAAAERAAAKRAQKQSR